MGLSVVSPTWPHSADRPKKGNKGIGIGIIVPLEEEAPVGTSLLANHFNSTGAAMPQSTTMEVMKKKKGSSDYCHNGWDEASPIPLGRT
jgi:hypothetical protein